MPARALSLVAAVLLLFAPAVLAADLPPWDDDSGITLNAFPRHFAPARESANLVARVYHPIDSGAAILWRIAISDEAGRVRRHFTAKQTYQPGEELLLSVTWNGRDDDGKLLPDGLYTAQADFEMRAVRERWGVLDREEGATGRVEVIRQHVAQPLRIDSVHPGRRAEVLAQTPHDPGVPYNFYYGTLHNQTKFSDGGHPNDASCASSTIHGAGDFDPAAAYNYARNTGRLDFLGITDHNHQFNDACSGCTAAQVVQRYHDGLNAAAAATVDGAFVGIYGMEWGYISNPDAGFPNEGHVGVYESPKLFGWEPSSTCTVGVDCYYEVYTASSSTGYTPMYTKALQNPSAWGAFGQFNHPSDGTKSAAGQGVDYNTIQYTTDGDDFIHTVAVVSGPATDSSTTTTDTGALYAGEPVNGPNYAAYTSIDMFNRILGAGYHVAPVADPDVHCSNYGTSTRDRTVILSPSLTKAALFDAIHNRRVYATTDPNTQLVYNMNAGATTYWMGAGGIRTGGPIATSGAITLHISVWDPDGEVATSIKIKEPVTGNTNGADTTVATSAASPFDYTFTPSSGKHTYYAYVTLNNGDRLWSAPIWINQGGTPDTTPPATSITSPAGGATVSGTTSVTASASDNVGVTKVEFYLDNVLQATTTTAPYSWNWNTTTSANGSHALSSKAYDAAANVGTSASVSVTVSNAAPDTTPPATSITSPASGATVSGTTSVTASASDNVGVTKVEFYLDNVLQATTTTAPYSWSWNTTTSANGSHALSSKAYDAAANVGTSASVSVTVSNAADTTPPTAPGSLVASIPTSGNPKRKINLSWTASTDNVGVSGYQIWRATNAAGPFSQIATTTTTTYSNGGLSSGTTYYYYVKAYDAAGNISAASNTASAIAN